MKNLGFINFTKKLENINNPEKNDFVEEKSKMVRIFI